MLTRTWQRIKRTACTRKEGAPNGALCVGALQFNVRYSDLETTEETVRCGRALGLERARRPRFRTAPSSPTPPNSEHAPLPTVLVPRSPAGHLHSSSTHPSCATHRAIARRVYATASVFMPPFPRPSLRVCLPCYSNHLAPPMLNFIDN
jgi:hypothetical protein